jgi:hypothetical protein
MHQMAHQRYNPSVDEIVVYITSLLKNGETPQRQTILRVLKEVAEEAGENRFRLTTKEQQR